MSDYREGASEQTGSKNVINDFDSEDQSVSKKGSIARKSLRGSVKGSIRSGSRRFGNRVQVISDFQSESDQSNIDVSVNELGEINQEIQVEEQQKLVKKRMQNVYDILGIAEESHHLHSKVQAVIS